LATYVKQSLQQGLCPSDDDLRMMFRVIKGQATTLADHPETLEQFKEACGIGSNPVVRCGPFVYAYAVTTGRIDMNSDPLGTSQSSSDSGMSATMGNRQNSPASFERQTQHTAYSTPMQSISPQQSIGGEFVREQPQRQQLAAFTAKPSLRPPTPQFRHTVPARIPSPAGSLRGYSHPRSHKNDSKKKISRGRTEKRHSGPRAESHAVSRVGLGLGLGLGLENEVVEVEMSSGCVQQLPETGATTMFDWENWVQVGNIGATRTSTRDTD